MPDGGALIAGTTLHHSNDVYFRERLPWRLGLVGLDCGPSVVAHVMEDCRIGERVRMSVRLDRSGRAVMVAMPPDRRRPTWTMTWSCARRPAARGADGRS